MATKGKFWTQRKPADMHGDGVHFNEEQLARKEAKEKEDKEIDKNAKKSEE